MSVTNYDSNHKLIIPPVSFADVNSLFGMSYTKLGELCQSEYINRWARYKPVKFDAIDTITGNMDANNKWLSLSNKAGNASTSAWYKANDGKCGLTIKAYNNITTLCQDMVGDGWEKAWTYSRPTGYSSDPFRLSDFSYYIHCDYPDYDKPFTSFMFGGVSSTVFWVDSDNYISGEGSVYKNQYTNPYLITFDEMWERQGYSSFANTYFGVAIYRASGSESGSTWTDRIYVITSKNSWNENVEHYGKDIRVTQPIDKMVFQIKTAEYWAVPLLSTVRYDEATLMSGAQNGVTFYPLPLSPVKVTVQSVVKTIRITPSILSAGKSGSGITIKLRLTAKRLETVGQYTWSGNIHKIVVFIAEGGDVGSSRTIDGTYTVPASSDFSPSGTDFPKTCDMTIQLNGTTGCDWVQIYIQTSNTQEWVIAGTATDVSI